MAVMPDVPFLDCGLILNLLFLEAMAAAVPSNEIKLHIKISFKSELTVYLEFF